MERFTHIPQEFVDQQRAERAGLQDARDYLIRDVIAYYEDPTAPGTWHPSKLRENDDVIVYGQRIRVVGPAEGRGWFAGVTSEEWGTTLSVYPLADITDRAPADPNEPGPPMPLSPAVEPPPEPDPMAAAPGEGGDEGPAR